MKYHIITIGCYMNQADSERIAAFLEKYNYQVSNNWLDVNLFILTTCGIRQSAEDRVYGLINRIKKINSKAKIVVTGCLSKREDVKKRLKHQVDLFMPINELPNMLKLLDKSSKVGLLNEDKLRVLSGEKYLGIIPKRQSIFSAYLPIGNGCNNFCSYCVVPYARGREVYRSSQDIEKEVKSLVASGYKEIILIAQNVNSYRSGSVSFSKLLDRLGKIKGNFWIRFSSSHPKDLSDELIQIISKNTKICNHLHLALQSGDDQILEAMNRKYNAQHFCHLIDQIRAARPGISITTDVIVGFPGETKKQFNNTLKIFKKLAFEMAYISLYSPRPGTVSWNMKDSVSLEEKKKRSKALELVLKKSALMANQKYLNQIIVVLVEGINKKGYYFGKTSSFKDVQFKGVNEDIIGTFVNVKIEQVKNFSLAGKLVS